MGLWARANGKEPPKLPRLNVVRSMPGLDYPTQAQPEPHALVAHVHYDTHARDASMWIAEFRDLNMKRTETSQVRAWVWAVTAGQRLADKVNRPVTVVHFFRNDGRDLHGLISAAAWRGEMGPAGFLAYGKSEDDQPPHAGLTTILPTWAPSREAN